MRLLVGTRKGAFVLRSDAARKTWAVEKPHFFGHVVHHMLADPREPKTWLVAAKTGHLGPTVFRSRDGGRSWKEAKTPPAFPKAEGRADARAVDAVFWLTPGHASEPGAWYAGSSPAGIFRSDDHGDTWRSVAGFNDHPSYGKWTEFGGTPNGQFLHSILVDPRDPRRLYASISVGGTFESTDGGATWEPLNAGIEADFLPDASAPYGHDPHCVALHPLLPDRLYQQNHCGIYRLDRPGRTWTRIGRAMPKTVGDIGFPVVLHPRDPETLWVFPMDGTEVWPRTSPGGKPAVYRSTTGGKKWQRLDKGLPPAQAWLTVKRQAMCSDQEKKVGLYFGTTCGEVWASRDEGESWKCAARHLPEIYSVAALP